MTDHMQQSKIVPLRNVMTMLTLVQRVIDREPRLPGMAVFYGYSGFGKSTALAYSANSFGAAHVEMLSTWTKKEFCQAILEELEIPAPKQVTKMVTLIGEELGSTGRPLFIDEADRLVTRNLLDLVRDFHDIAQANTFRGAGANIILVGEEDLPTELSRTERFHGRIFDSVPAMEAALEDIDSLAPFYAKGVDIAPDLKEEVLVVSRHSIRRVCSNLAAVRECGQREGLTTVDKAAWEAYSEATGKQFSTGKPPRPRGLL
jgi:DNA transposition AAA+ family ATPase